MGRQRTTTFDRSEIENILEYDGIDAKGWSKLNNLIWDDDALTSEAITIYAYLSSCAKAGETKVPQVSVILKKVKMSEDRFYRHRKLLLDYNYIRVEYVKQGNLYRKCIYHFVSNPVSLEKQYDRRIKEEKQHIAAAEKNQSDNSIVQIRKDAVVKLAQLGGAEVWSMLTNEVRNHLVFSFHSEVFRSTVEIFLEALAYTLTKADENDGIFAFKKQKYARHQLQKYFSRLTIEDFNSIDKSMNIETSKLQINNRLIYALGCIFKIVNLKCDSS